MGIVDRATYMASAVADYRAFGIGVAWPRLMLSLPYSRIGAGRWEEAWRSRAQGATIQYLQTVTREVISEENFADIPVPKDGISTVWTMWWYGEDSAPEVVRACIRSQRKWSTRPLICITRENVEQYVAIPDWLLAGVRDGYVSITELSCFIRADILARFGGLWLDATVFLSGPLPQHVFSKQFITGHNTGDPGRSISKGQWTSYLIGSVAGHPIMRALAGMHKEYWKIHRRQIDYFLMDDFLHILRLYAPEVDQSFQDGYFDVAGIHDLAAHWVNPATDDLWAGLIARTVVHKVSWKIDPPLLVDGCDSIYRKMLLQCGGDG